MATTRDPITTHVLDSTTGIPAANIPVTLSLLNPVGPSNPFSATTSPDGRITNWVQHVDGPSLVEVFANLSQHEEGRMVWSLRFDTLSYWGKGKTFYPTVEVQFLVEAGADGKIPHYHVPVLLGPYSYTTYRGS